MLLVCVCHVSLMVRYRSMVPTYCCGAGVAVPAQSGRSNVVNDSTPGGFHAGCPTSVSIHCTVVFACVAAHASMRHSVDLPLLRGPQTTATVGASAACLTMDAIASRHASGSGADGVMCVPALVQVALQ